MSSSNDDGQIDVGRLREVASVDQQCATMRDIGQIVCAYHDSLRKNGLPEELAAEILVDFHSKLWIKRFGLTTCGGCD